jgi:two-component system, sensor histidine kinase and response regulator
LNDAAARYRILLAECATAAPPATADLLTRAGYAVDAVADGLAAVDLAGSHPYDLILIDLDLDPSPPGLDALETARRIRRLARPRGDVPILAIAGDRFAGLKDRCAAAGMDGCLARPIGLVALLEAVAHWVEASEDPAWGLEPRPGTVPPLLNRCTLTQLEEDVGTPLLPDILGTFLAESERRLGLLAARVAAGDAKGAADEAHALKGSAGTFGAMALRQAVFEMEQAGRAGDLGRVALLLPEIARLVGETCALLRAEYPFLAP